MNIFNIYADVDAISMTPSSNTRSYTLRSVPSSPGRSFFRKDGKWISFSYLDNGFFIFISNLYCIGLILSLVFYHTLIQIGIFFFKMIIIIVYQTIYHEVNGAVKNDEEPEMIGFVRIFQMAYFRDCKIG